MASKLVGDLTLGPGVVQNEHVNSNAAVDVSKLKHAYSPGTTFDLPIGGTPATREEIVHVANAAGVIRGFHCLLNDTGTTTSIAFDLKKNGTTVLSGVVTIVHGDADRSVHDGTLAGTTFVADDVLSIAMTVTSATGATGPYAWVALEESLAP